MEVVIETLSAVPSVFLLSLTTGPPLILNLSDAPEEKNIVTPPPPFAALFPVISPPVISKQSLDGSACMPPPDPYDVLFVILPPLIVKVHPPPIQTPPPLESAELCVMLPLIRVKRLLSFISTPPPVIPLFPAMEPPFMMRELPPFTEIPLFIPPVIVPPPTVSISVNIADVSTIIHRNGLTFSVAKVNRSRISTS